MSIVRFLFVVLLFSSCNEKKTKTTKPNTSDSARFFQLTDYINSQISEVNKTPYFIYKLTVNEDSKDSIPISNTEAAKLASHFTEPDLNDEKNAKDFRESVFFDETTHNYSLSYSTSNKDLVLQNVNVLLKEDGKSVKRIFLRKIYSYSDSSVIEQLTWKPNESFQINTLLQFPSKKEVSQQVTVIWNAKG